MNLIRAIACLALIATATSASAQDEAMDKKFFQNFTGVSKLLRANGVEPSRVEWGVVESTCLPLNDTKNPTDYNRCRFERARDQIVFRNDTRKCNSHAVATYPDALMRDEPIQSVRYVNGRSIVTTVTNVPISLSDLRASRRAAFDHCMLDKGWNSSGNYLMGRDAD